MAAKISDYAYDLFLDLLFSTGLLGESSEPEICVRGFCFDYPSLEDYSSDEDLASYYCDDGEKFYEVDFPSGHQTPRIVSSFICHNFHFSDYVFTCQDLLSYCERNYSKNRCLKIKSEIGDLLEKLAPLFIELYDECLILHPNSKIKKEKFLALSYLDLTTFDCFISSVNFSLFYNHDNIARIDYEYKKPKQNSLEIQLLLAQGTNLNSLLLYKDAIEVLTKALKFDRNNKECLIERAGAYFETNQISLALQDYETLKKLTVAPFINAHYLDIQASLYMPENKIDFSTGLISGVLAGGKVSTEEFFPSLFSSMRGLLNGLWAFTSSPKEVSLELINTAYAIGEFISTHNKEECLQCVIPELKELSQTWNKCNDHIRGKKIGFIIGKYGIDIFAPIGILNGVNKIKALKRANTVLTLECCAKSKAKQLKILEESSKHASLRTTIVSEVVKSSKICIKNSNVQYHIMQKKHAWDKIIKLSGNLEEDFKKIIILLEESQITHESHLIAKELYPRNFSRISKTIYEKKINSHMVHLEFETYLETGATFLQDAWVVTK